MTEIDASSKAMDRVEYARDFTPEELRLLTKGVKAEAMEEKWNIAMKSEGIFYFDRSWMGYNVFILKLTECGEPQVLAGVRAEQEPQGDNMAELAQSYLPELWVASEMLAKRGPAWALEHFNQVLETVVFGRPLPHVETNSDALKNWHLFGKDSLRSAT